MSEYITHICDKEHRYYGGIDGREPCPKCQLAADQERIRELEEALEPFAIIGRIFPNNDFSREVEASDCRRAVEVLKGKL